MQTNCKHTFKRVAVYSRKTGKLIGHDCVDCGERKRVRTVLTINGTPLSNSVYGVMVDKVENPYNVNPMEVKRCK